MRMPISALPLLLLPVLFLPNAPLMAQFGPLTGSIRGLVVNEGGGPLEGAFVVADRIPPATRFSQTAKSGPGGVFQVQGLPPGTYRLCAQVPGAPYLDPCHWSVTPTTVTLSAGQSSVGNLIVLRKASKLLIRIQDPNHHLSPRSSLVDPPEIVMGVGTPAGTTYPARLASTDRSGRTYQVPVPFDAPLTLTLSAARLRINDERGLALPNGPATLNFQHVSGGFAQKTFLFTIVGRAE